MNTEAKSIVGSNLEPVKFTPEQIARFWGKVKKTDGDSCWEWQGCLSTNTGYGNLTIERKSRSSHRVSFEMNHHAIPPKMCVCHRCDNRKCIRPDHLFLGTHADNMQDQRLKGRGPQGEKNGGAKLNWQLVAEIRELGPKTKGAHRKLGRAFGVSATAIKDILIMKTWKNPPMAAN